MSLISRASALLCVLLATPAWADDVMSGIGDLVPDSYKQLPVTPNAEAFTGVDRAKCNNGVRIGGSLAREFIQRFPVDCAALILPLDDEWVVPAQAETDSFRICFDASYRYTIAQTVLNTARNCATQLDQNFKLTMQMEYNRCYVETAGNIGALPITFGQVPGFIEGAYVVIPRDSAEWDSFIDSLTVTINGDGTTQPSPQLKQACRLGASDAALKRDPINLFTGTRVPIDR